MDILKLVDGMEYQCINSVGGMDGLKVTLRTADFEALKNSLSRANLREIKITNDTGITGVYVDFTNVSPYQIKVNSDGTMDVTVTFTKEDEVQAKINELEENVTNNELALVELYEMLIGGL